VLPRMEGREKKTEEVVEIRGSEGLGMSEISVDMQIACVERELALRRRVYPRWVKTGKFNQVRADFEIDAMAAVLETLKSLRPEIKQRVLFEEESGAGGA
jgi:hypothetical protein